MRVARGRCNGAFQGLAKIRGDGRLANLVGLRVERHVNDRTFAGGEERVPRGIRRKNPKPVAQAAGADFLDPQADFECLLESRRLEILAGNFEARPTLMKLARRGMDAKAQRPEERVLGTFSKPQKIREVHDAGEVGVGELDDAAVTEMKISRVGFGGGQGEIG